MKIRNQIEGQIRKEVEYALDELDIDGMIAKMTSSKAVKEEIEKLVKEKIARTFQDKVLLQYHKREQLIDAWSDSQLTELFIKLGIK